MITVKDVTSYIYTIVTDETGILVTCTKTAPPRADPSITAAECKPPLHILCFFFSVVVWLVHIATEIRLCVESE